MSKILFKDKKVLVTGAAGVIGRELLRYLIEEEADILSVDRLPLPDGDWDNVRHIRKDLAEDDLQEGCLFGGRSRVDAQRISFFGWKAQGGNHEEPRNTAPAEYV